MHNINNLGEVPALLKLSEDISKNAALLSKFIEENKLQQPSFEQDTPADVIPSQYRHNTQMMNVRSALIQSALDLYNLATGPADRVLTFHQHNMDFYVMQTMGFFGWPQMVPLGKDAEISIKEIAQKSKGMDEMFCARILRYAISFGFFKEHRTGYISHSAFSAEVHRNSNASDFLRMCCETACLCANKMCDSLNRCPKDTGEASDCAFSLWSGKPNYWEWLAENPEMGRFFPGSMAYRVQGGGFDVSHVINGYDWGKNTNATIVDVGGSRGEILLHVARKNPMQKYIILDLPEVISNPIEMEPSVKERFTFVGHDFFKPFPDVFKNADVYLIRQILHDWSDKYCLKMLKNVIPMLKPGAIVIVNEFIMPPPSNKDLPANQEKIVRLMDLTMLTMFNSKERTVEDICELLKTADPRLKFVTVKTPPGSITSVLEFIFEGNH